MKVRELMAAAARTNPAELTINATVATDFETKRCRDAVRGLRWSSDQSSNRLQIMAAVRAQTMQARTRSNTRNEGRPFAATINAPRAKGRAKMVCENRISRRNRMTGPSEVGLGLSGGCIGSLQSQDSGFWESLRRGNEVVSGKWDFSEQPAG